MITDRVLAKSTIGGLEVTLEQHTRDVINATTEMFGDMLWPTRLAVRWLAFFRVPEQDFPAFLRNLLLAACFHDIGKANDGFDALIRHRGQQAIRHEHLSGLIIWLKLQDWLAALQHLAVDPDIVLSAVVAHHLKVNDRCFAAKLLDSDRAAVNVRLSSTDMEAVLALAGVCLGTNPPASETADERWDFEALIPEAAEDFLRHMARVNRQLKHDEVRLRLLVAVKAALIAVDSAGSAIRREGLNLGEWLKEMFQSEPLTRGQIDAEIIEPRVRELQALGRWRGFDDFQEAAADLPSRALLLAGCGSGKTLAAWKWIAAQLDHGKANRALFLYPTRGTATEGFRDYVAWAGPSKSALFHGTAEYDLLGMFGNPDERTGFDYTTPERMFALGYWGRRIFSATVDGFLAFMSNRYGPLCMLPLLADSVVVIDEVHSFDPQMFRALERFLTFFDVPVLCMTASLTSDRLRTLRETCGLQVFPNDPSQFVDLERRADAKRYRINYIKQEQAADIALQALNAGRRVMWVVNTVSRCQELARRFTEKATSGAELICYHGRFRLQDRKARHERVIADFRPPATSVLLITTQVCEMSLDLDADVLITEAAPVPALIQRMGRCCRLGDGRIGDVHIYSPENERPYERADVGQGEALGCALDGQIVSQLTLASYLDELAVANPHMSGGFTSFLDSGWYAMSVDDRFRDEDDWTVECVLDGDRDLFVKMRRGRDPEAQGFILPVPRRFASLEAVPGTYLHVASSSHYLQDFGFIDDAGAKS